jgi:hypothetical protein
MKKIVLLITITLSAISTLFAQRGAMSSNASIINDLANAAIAEAAVSDIQQEAIGGLLEVIKNAASSSSSADGVFGSANPLSSTECVPEFSDDVNARMNYLCSPESECQECYDGAREKMNFCRRQLGRLRCVYNNIKTYKDNALALGDNMSGIHAMAGIAWQNERGKIVANFENTKRIYDEKSSELLASLQTALNEFNACENRFGEGDWYAKSGFIYYEFMVEKYKRND